MAAQGEIDVFGKLVARTTDGKICNAEQVDGIDAYAKAEDLLPLIYAGL